MSVGDVIEEGTMRLTIALIGAPIGALVVVDDDNNNTMLPKPQRRYTAQPFSQTVIYTLSICCRSWSYSHTILSNYRRCHRHFQKLMRTCAIPDPAVGIASFSYTRMRSAASSIKYAKIDILMSEFQNVSPCRARVEAEQRKGRKYLAAQVFTRGSVSSVRFNE